MAAEAGEPGSETDLAYGRCSPQVDATCPLAREWRRGQLVASVSLVEPDCAWRPGAILVHHGRYTPSSRTCAAHQELPCCRKSS